LVEVKGVGEFVKSHGSGLLGKGSLSSLDHSLSVGFTVVGLVFTVVGLHLSGSVLSIFTTVVLSHVSLSSLAQGVLDVGVFTGVGGSLLEERPGTSVDDVTVFLVGFFNDGTIGLLVRDGDHLGVHLGNLLLVLLVVSLLGLLVLLSVFTVVDVVGVFTSVVGLLEERPGTSVDDGTVFLVGDGVVSMFTVVSSVVSMVGVFTVVVSVVGVFTVVSSVVVSVVGVFTVVVTVVGNVVFFTVVVGLLSKGNSSESEDGNSSHNERAE